MKDLFYNTSEILKFIIRRERIRQLIWILAFSLFLVALVPVFENIISTSSDMKVLIETVCTYTKKRQRYPPMNATIKFHS